MNPRRSSGFSLAELLVSMMVFTVGILGFATAIGVSATEIFVGGRDTDVAMLTFDQMERLKALGPDQVEDGQRTEGLYTLRWEVRGSEPKEVILIVTYPGHRGGERADSIIGYVAR